jgi:GDP/UDP-N,N'-diacetylbacillosamine 2-epimerase (hydrolysing)
MIDEYCQDNAENAMTITSMGQLLYLSTMAEVDIVIGNSSSGIIEAPSLETPTVNIGKRQQGRIKAKSVIDCDCESKAIVSAIKKGLSIDKTCGESVYENPYELDGTSSAIIRHLKAFNCHNIQKSFFDIAIG